jgi:hypothetical protein
VTVAASTTKKAVVQRFEKEALAGYINPLSYLQLTGIELLSPQGNVTIVPYGDVKMVSFVREFDNSEPGRHVFQNRPKMEGLWVRLEYRDGDVRAGPRCGGQSIEEDKEGQARSQRADWII